MEKDLEIFKDELLTFEDRKSGVYEFTKEVLKFFPEAFWKCRGNEKMSGVVAHTKESVMIANTLMELEHVRERFHELDRDMIRSALLLHDGFLYADGKETVRQPDHPYIMSIYIMNRYWEAYLPAFLRTEISGMVEAHSGQWNRSGNIAWKKPSKDNEYFVHECVYLASKKTAVSVCQATEKQTNAPERIASAFDFASTLKIVGQMVDGRNWDGSVYHDEMSCYTYIDGQKVPVAGILEAAFVTAGQVRHAKIASMGTYRNMSTNSKACEEYDCHFARVGCQLPPLKP